MSELRIELPADVRAELTRRTGGDTTAEAAWVAEAIRERVAALEQIETLETRAARGSRAGFERVLANVPAADPVPNDEL